ncbi:hypothetical protein ABID14_000202 [Peptoniphilus olsenii]|uniref:Uncharacterized protein n=1 Tax=Peptoniphilus olsenii TaxID=411570 RepID=A0ABV2J729_9FIRM
MADINGYTGLSVVENPYFGIDEVLKNFQKYNTYMMTGFADRIVELPWTFEVVDMGVADNGNRLVHLKFYEGEVIEEGTDLSEMNLGNVDVAVAILYEWRKYVDNVLLQQALKTDGLEMTTLNGLIANAFGVTFDDLDNIKVIRGYYDEPRGEVWS